MPARRPRTAATTCAYSYYPLLMGFVLGHILSTFGRLAPISPPPILGQTNPAVEPTTTTTTREYAAVPQSSILESESRKNATSRTATLAASSLLKNNTSSQDSTILSLLLLEQQTRVQEQFQEWIHTTQSPSPHDCPEARILYKTHDRGAVFDGFANEVQFFSRYLQVAVATHRVLVVSPMFRSAYASSCNDSPKQNGGRRSLLLACLWTPVSDCAVQWQRNIVPDTSGGIQHTNHEPPSASSNPYQDHHTTMITSAASQHPDPLGVGIIEKVSENEQTSSDYFSSNHYGPARIVTVPRTLHRSGGGFLLADVIPHYERQYGRFWVRAQMAHYWWHTRPTAYLTNAIRQRMMIVDNNNNNNNNNSVMDAYIAFHVRLTDNAADLERHFRRNATVTRDFDRFMSIATHIRNANPNVQHIFVATDNTEVAKLVTTTGAADTTTTRSKYQHPWTFHLQNDVPRASRESKRLWFKDKRSDSVGAIGADIETLRRADYLVGSFQSNVYRLAAELNIAYHASKYLWNGQRRIYSVDVEWYEDP